MPASQSTLSSTPSLFFCCRVGRSHASASLLSGWVDVVTGLERQEYTQCPYSVTSCHWLWLAPNTCIQAPYSTANKSLSSDTIRGKVCSRSLAQTLSAFGPDLFRSSHFQPLDVWHERIDMLAVMKTVRNTVMFLAALMVIVIIIIKLIGICVSAPFWHFIHRCLLSLLRGVSEQLFTWGT